MASYTPDVSIREAVLQPSQSAILFIDTQNLHPHYTLLNIFTPEGSNFYTDKIVRTLDPKFFWDIIPQLQPIGDEIVLPKTSSNVFVSTNILIG